MKKMKLHIIAFICTLIASVIGMLIDSNVGMDGNFSVTMAIATMGAFLLYSHSNNKD